MKTLRDDIVSIVGQATSKTRLDMVSHKNIPRIHVQVKWDNNNKHIMEYKFKLQMKGR